MISVLERVVRGKFVGALVSDPSRRRLPLMNVASLVALKCDPADVKRVALTAPLNLHTAAATGTFCLSDAA